MQAHRLKVLIPENRQLVVEFPEELPAGPAELIVLISGWPAAGKTEPVRVEPSSRLGKLRASWAQDPRPFRELSREERRARLQQVMGAGRGLSSTSEEFAEEKQREIEREERRFAS
jgi:hypothetical protein